MFQVLEVVVSICFLNEICFCCFDIFLSLCPDVDYCFCSYAFTVFLLVFNFHYSLGSDSPPVVSIRTALGCWTCSYMERCGCWHW